MKTLFVILSLLLVMPVCAETIVERQITTTRPVVVAPSSTVTTTTTTITEAPVHVGMLLSQVYELMGPPTTTKVFRKFNGRVVEYYDQRLTYKQPTGETQIFIKNSKVGDIQYIDYVNVEQDITTTTTTQRTQY